MLHIYCGDGKGKTTAAMGLALRCAGRGEAVLIAQFCKGADSGERYALEKIPNIRLLPVPPAVKFTFSLTEEEKAAERDRYLDLLEQIRAALGREEIGLLVLDEACAAVGSGLVELEDLLAVLDLCRERGTEAVLTGRDPDPRLVERADYVTLMKKVCHPYDRGQSARRGIEF